MMKVGVVLCGILLALGSLESANSTLVDGGVLVNGNFASGLSGWTINNPSNHALGTKSIDIDGSGPLASSNAFFVQTGGGFGTHDVRISPSMEVQAGREYSLFANIAASYVPIDPKAHPTNLSGGIITVALGGKTISSYDFGEITVADSFGKIITANAWEFATLSASFVASTTGILDISFFRPWKTVPDSPINYLDNVSLVMKNGAGAPVPEPATLLLVGTGLTLIAGFGRKKGFRK